MNENATKAPGLHRERPATLTRRSTPALRLALSRVLPDDKPKLDVAAFNSSI